jgi:glycerophosphoryl diester phosphodiesterase
MTTFSRYVLVSALSLISTLASATSGHAPAIVAHRGGTADAPENTLVAIRSALKNGVDAVWITLQRRDRAVPPFRPEFAHG